MGGDGFRLVAVGQVFGSQSQPLPEPAIPLLPSDRALYLQQQPLKSVEPHEGAWRLIPPETTGWHVNPHEQSIFL